MKKTRERLMVGLTGGIGSGKSEALRELKHLGAASIDLDAIAREQAERGKPAYRALVKAYGRGLLDSRGEIDRARLAEKAFAGAAARKRLESLTHPLILREMRRQAAGSRGVVVVDVPLLFEGGHEKEFDVTMLVTAPRGTRLARLEKRGMGRAEALRRMKAQLPDEKKASRADLVVSNAGTRAALRRALKEYHDAFVLMQQSPT